MDRHKKIAQERGFFDKVKENINPIANIPFIFSDNLREIKNALIEYDDAAREEAKNIKGHLKKSETLFNRKEYVNSVLEVREFYYTCKTVLFKLSELNKKVNELSGDVRNQMLYGDQDKESIKRLIDCSRCNGYGTRRSGDPCFSCEGTGKQLKNPESKKPEAKQQKQSSYTAFSQIEKEAGISDWWHNLTNDKARSVIMWEKAFPKASKKIKSNISKLISESKNFEIFLLQTFKELSSARADRRIEDYLSLQKKLQERFWGSGQFNDKYLNCIKLIFDDDVIFLYKYIGEGDAANKAVQKLVEDGASINAGSGAKEEVSQNDAEGKGAAPTDETAKQDGTASLPAQGPAQTDSHQDELKKLENERDEIFSQIEGKAQEYFNVKRDLTKTVPADPDAKGTILSQINNIIKNEKNEKIKEQLKLKNKEVRGLFDKYNNLTGKIKELADKEKIQSTATRRWLLKKIALKIEAASRENKRYRW